MTAFGKEFHNSSIFSVLIIAYIPSTASRFEQFYPKAQNAEQLSFNAKVLLDVCSELYGAAAWQSYSPEKVFLGSALELQLFTLLLFQTLPHFVAAAEVDFTGPLHGLETRFIELSNTSGKPVGYVANLTGANEFFLDENSFVIPAKSQYRLKVNFKSRFSRQSGGILTVRSKNICLNSTSILSFKLFANVDPPKSIQIVKVETVLYASPAHSVKLDIQSPFSEDGCFRIQMHQQKPKRKEYLAAKSLHVDPPAFTLSQEILEIPANGKMTFEVRLIPFEIGLHECTLLFYDPNVGEFIIKIEGKAVGPPPLDQNSWTCTSGIAVDKVIRLVSGNIHREKAINSYLALNSLSRLLANKSKSVKERLTATGERNLYQLPKVPIKYKVEFTSPYFSGPSEIIIKPKMDGKAKGSFSEEIYTELPINFFPKASGKYMCRVILTCEEYSDYRIYLINGLARSEGLKADLEFIVPAKEMITQEIPIINNTEDDWNIRATLHGEHFWAPFMLTAKAGNVTNFPIDFRPQRKCDITGQLILNNSTTNQKYLYNLKGIGLDPEPEEIMTIQCKAREKMSLSFKVENDLPIETTFDIVTDLPICNGKKKIIIRPGASELYTLDILPLHSGTSLKFIKFLNKRDDFYSWYSVKVSVSPAAPDIEMSLISFVRETTIGEISVSNSLDKDTNFTVQLLGSELDGPSSFELEKGKESSIYRFTYSPSKNSRNNYSDSWKYGWVD